MINSKCVDNILLVVFWLSEKMFIIHVFCLNLCTDCSWMKHTFLLRHMHSTTIAIYFFWQLLVVIYNLPLAKKKYDEEEINFLLPQFHSLEWLVHALLFMSFNNNKYLKQKNKITGSSGCYMLLVSSFFVFVCSRFLTHSITMKLYYVHFLFSLSISVPLFLFIFFELKPNVHVPLEFCTRASLYQCVCICVSVCRSHATTAANIYIPFCSLWGNTKTRISNTPSERDGIWNKNQTEYFKKKTTTHTYIKWENWFQQEWQVLVRIDVTMALAVPLYRIKV